VPRILLVDDSASARHLLAARLREKGFDVVDAPDAGRAAELAIAQPPNAVVTDLWMPDVSGLQLCRLLRAEPATAGVPIVLLTASDDRRSRFWARCAGATAYVTKTEIGPLVSLLQEVTRNGETLPPATIQPNEKKEPVRVQEKLSALLDSALYDATIAGEVRSLSHTDGDLTRLFTELAKLASDVVTYRWLALSTSANDGSQLMLHTHPSSRRVAEEEARHALNVAAAGPIIAVEDDRPLAAPGGSAPLVLPVRFGALTMGSIALGPSPRGISSEDRRVVELVAHELGGALRMASLVGEARRLAATDSLTGLMNRRAFMEAMDRERSRAERHTLPVSVLMLDVDHFKKVNDTKGHEAGDCVLRGIGQVLRKIARKSDVVARWGGEEFVVALAQTAEAGGRVAAERVRRSIADAEFALPSGEILRVTASVGLASTTSAVDLDELLGRADKALYAAKHRGRNRIEIG
jgi:two-component system cell cycle response regulator